MNLGAGDRIYWGSIEELILGGQLSHRAPHAKPTIRHLI